MGKQSDSTAKNIAKGAATVAAAAGVVAAGAALADKDTRESLAEGAQNLVSTAKEQAKNISSSGKEVSHQISRTKSKATGKKSEADMNT